MTAYSWLEYYTLQATAIRNAFSDLNADVSNTVIACPAVPGMGAPCPLSPRIYASAFSQATFGPGVNTAGSTQYSALYPADSYPYLGSLTVQFEHLTFPPNGAPTASNSSLGSGTQSASQQNLDAFSVHSYGKTGAGLSSLGSSTALAIATLRAENTITPTLPVIPYAVTEHAAHTTATFNNISTTGDTPFEASRLAAQMLFQARRLRARRLRGGCAHGRTRCLRPGVRVCCPLRVPAAAPPLRDRSWAAGRRTSSRWCAHAPGRRLPPRCPPAARVWLRRPGGSPAPPRAVDAGAEQHHHGWLHEERHRLWRRHPLRHPEDGAAVG